jgi:hypothetical protein
MTEYDELSPGALELMAQYGELEIAQMCAELVAENNELKLRLNGGGEVSSVEPPEPCSRVDNHAPHRFTVVKGESTEEVYHCFGKGVPSPKPVWKDRVSPHQPTVFAGEAKSTSSWDTTRTAIAVLGDVPTIDLNEM